MNKSFHFLMTLAVFVIYVSSSMLTMLIILFMTRIHVYPFSFFATMWMPVVPLVTCMVISTALTGIVYRRLLRPLEELTRMAEKVSKGDFSVRVNTKHAYGTVQTLIDRFNSMAKELGSTEMLKSDFINTFSHEFKTPIVSIRGFAKQLGKEGLSEEQRKEYVSIIVSESERLTTMSTNVLLLSRLENQQVVTNRAPFRLDDQLRDCVLLLEKQWSKKDISWNLELGEITLNDDASLLEHIWINLLNNAVKFSPEHSEIDITATESEHTVQISIRDHGAGMTQETSAHIFDKFYQGDTSHASEGNGLGLSIVKRIVELEKGEITVISEPMHGTTFRIRLPKGGK